MVMTGDVACWPCTLACWRGDTSGLSWSPSPAQTRLTPQLIQPDIQIIAGSEFSNASPTGNWLVWGSQSCWCTALPFSEISFFWLDFPSAALLLGNEGTCFDISNPWVLQRHTVFPVNSCTFLHPRSYPSPTKLSAALGVLTNHPHWLLGIAMLPSD